MTVTVAGMFVRKFFENILGTDKDCWEEIGAFAVGTGVLVLGLEIRGLLDMI